MAVEVQVLFWAPIRIKLSALIYCADARDRRAEAVLICGRMGGVGHAIRSYGFRITPNDAVTKQLIPSFAFGKAQIEVTQIRKLSYRLELHGHVILEPLYDRQELRFVS